MVQHMRKWKHKKRNSSKKWKMQIHHQFTNYQIQQLSRVTEMFGTNKILLQTNAGSLTMSAKALISLVQWNK